MRGIVKGGLNNGGSNIKSIQHGVYSWYNTYSAFVSISPVDLSKSILLVQSQPSTSGYTAVYLSGISGKFVMNNQIQLNSKSSCTGTFNIYWTVIEFNNVKSVQRGTVDGGTYTAAYTTQNINISPVNIQKSFAVVSMRSGQNDGDITAYTCIPLLSNSTTLSLIYVANQSVSIEWQVIEFN